MATAVVEARFLEKMIPEPNTGCWLWMGGKRGVGYGEFSGDYAHRAAYGLFVGEIPSGLVVRHKCDNRACVNPSHLEVGTTQDNADDCTRRGRRQRGSRRPLAKLTEPIVAEIKALLAAGDQTHEEIGARFGAPPKMVSKIAAGRSWTHVPWPEVDNRRRLQRLTPEVRAAILAECAAGARQADVGAKYGFGQTHVSRIVRAAATP